MELLYSLIFIVVVTTFITCRPSGGDNSKKMERDGETAMEDIEMIDKDVYEDQDLVYIDIRLTDHQKKLLNQEKRNRQRRDTIGKNNEVASWLNIWKNKVIPYKFDSKFSSEKYRNVVRDALKDLQDKVSSCIQFKELPANDWATRNHILIQNNPGCWSHIGFVGGLQVLNLQYSSTSARCAKPHIVQHEMMHSLGFYHEQSREDRDQYVTINYENIMEGVKGNFEIAHGSKTLDVKYDTKSIMHYSKGAFSTNGNNTISRKGNPDEVLGGKFLTDLDIMQIKMLYSCNVKTTTTTTTKKPTNPKTTTTTTTTTTKKPTKPKTTTTTTTTTTKKPTEPTTITTTTTTTRKPTKPKTSTTTTPTTTTTTTTPTTTTTTTQKVIIIVDPKTTTTTTGSNQCNQIQHDCLSFYHAVNSSILSFYCTYPSFETHCPRTCKRTRCDMGKTKK